MKSDPQYRHALCYLQRKLPTVQHKLRGENAVGHRRRSEEAQHRQFLAERQRLRANGNVWTPAKALQQGWLKGEEQGSQSEGLLEKSHLCVTIVPSLLAVKKIKVT